MEEATTPCSTRGASEGLLGGQEQACVEGKGKPVSFGDYNSIIKGRKACLVL